MGFHGVRYERGEMTVGRHGHRRLTCWHWREEVPYPEFGQGLELSDDLVRNVGHPIKDKEEEGSIDYFSRVKPLASDEEFGSFFGPPDICDLPGVGVNAGGNRGLQVCVLRLWELLPSHRPVRPWGQRTPKGAPPGAWAAPCCCSSGCCCCCCCYCSCCC